MGGPPFKLGTFASADRRFAGLVMADRVIDLAAIHPHFAKSSGARSGVLSDPGSVLGLLQDWVRNFATLQAIAAFIANEGMDDEPVKSTAYPLGALRVLPPIIRPPKLLYAAANYREHVAGMHKTFRNDLPAIEPSKDYQADKTKSEAYLFFKGNNCLAGAYDDVILPEGVDRIDWEAELAVVIGRQGKNIPAGKAMNHVAGFMTTNDISARSRTWRLDRPSIRSDWMGGKSYDTFAPMGPFFVPAAFVPDPANLRIWCAVNGVTKQDGNSGDMVFGIEDHIAYGSKMMTLESGDVFATGTPAGTGQERLEFLKEGDLIETEVEGLGRQRNRVVAGSATYSAGLDAPR
jgi:2,4-didehydro-3-deoxy-L-rhamnonate hydrolase